MTGTMRCAEPGVGDTVARMDGAYRRGGYVLSMRIETPGGTFFIDASSVLYLIGTTMDWVEDDFAAGFVFNNPNAKGSCGCGESFTV